jgi:LysM repeat protein
MKNRNNLLNKGLIKSLFTVFMIFALACLCAQAGTYTVKGGDTLSKISQTYYGNPNLWTELQRYNNIPDANLIYPGDSLTIPGKDTLQAMSNASSLSAKQQIAAQAKANGGTLPSTPPPAVPTAPRPAVPTGATNPTGTATPTGSALPPVTPSEDNPRGVFHDPLRGMDVD